MPLASLLNSAIGGAIMISIVAVVYLACAWFWTFARLWSKNSGDLWARYKATIAQLDKMTRHYLEGQIFTHGLIALCIYFLLNFFFIYKSLISQIHYYSWDPVFAVWDKAVHFGHYPHVFLQSMAELSWVRIFFDKVYMLWFPVMYIFIGYNMFFDNNVFRRMRFFWVFALSWVLMGSIGATVFSSVGPVFYHTFYPDLADLYQDMHVYLMANAGELKIATQLRGFLLHWTQDTSKIHLNAISAMPSMHIAMCWLAVLYSWHIHKALAAFSLFFCLSVFLSAVYFGFHYAIDGYVSIAAISLLWWGLGKGLKKRYAPDSKLQPSLYE